MPFWCLVGFFFFYFNDETLSDFKSCEWFTEAEKSAVSWVVFALIYYRRNQVDNQTPFVSFEKNAFTSLRQQWRYKSVVRLGAFVCSLPLLKLSLFKKQIGCVTLFSDWFQSFHFHSLWLFSRIYHFDVDLCNGVGLVFCRFLFFFPQRSSYAAVRTDFNLVGALSLKIGLCCFHPHPFSGACEWSDLSSTTVKSCSPELPPPLSISLSLSLSKKRGTIRSTAVIWISPLSWAWMFSVTDRTIAWLVYKGGSWPFSSSPRPC